MAPTHILCFDLYNGQMTFKLEKVNFLGHGPAAGHLKLSNYAGCGGGTKSPFFRLCLSDFVKKWWADENAYFDNIVQPQPVSLCIAMAEGGPATAQIKLPENRLTILRFNTRFQDTE